MFYVAKVRTLLLVFDAFCAGQYILEEKGAENKKSQQQHLQSCAFEKRMKLPFLSGESIGRTSRTCKKQPRQTLSEVQSIMAKPAWLRKGYWKRLTFLVRTSEVHTKIIWNGKFALVRPKHLSSRPKTEIRPFSFFNKICYPFSHFFIPLGGNKSSRFFSYFLQIQE